MKNTGQYGGTSGIDIKAEQAWAITRGSSSIKIAVLDEGVDLTHPDLQANLLPGADYSSNPPGGANGSPYGDNAHGTACAGIIAAINNTIGIVGVASNCKIVPIRIAYNNDLDPYWEGFSDGGTADAINYAWETAEVDVLSNSWSGGTSSGRITTALVEAMTLGRGGKGCVVVFSSGNDDGGYGANVSYPANSHPNIIAVGAISYNGQRKSPSTPDGGNWGSNYGPELDVVAPGVKIYTTDITGGAGYGGGNYTSGFGGTSAACPQVAGVAALILSVDPSLHNYEVADIIERTAQKIGGGPYSPTAAYPYKARNDHMGYGLVSAYAAVNYVVNPPSPTYHDIWLTVFNQASYSTVFTIQVGNDPAFNTTIAAGGEYSKLYTAQEYSSLTFSVGAMGVYADHTVVVRHFGMVDFYWGGSYWDIQAMRAPADSLAQI